MVGLLLAAGADDVAAWTIVPDDIDAHDLARSVM